MFGDAAPPDTGTRGPAAGPVGAGRTKLVGGYAVADC
jgi:hypothetical protein